MRILCIFLVMFTIGIVTPSLAIQFKRGAESRLPVSGAIGEPIFTTDTHRLFIGTGTDKIEFVKKSDYDAALAQKAAVFTNDGILRSFSLGPNGEVTAPNGFGSLGADGGNAIDINNTIPYSGPRTAGVMFHNMTTFYVCPKDNICVRIGL